MPLAPDTLLQNRYRIIHQIGKGGMGTVYEAYDERLGTTVALKETHFTDERSSRQFEREARLLAKLRHPALIKVIDHFAEGDGQFLAMEYIPGLDLLEMLQIWGRQTQREPPFPEQDVLRWADQLLDVLEYLHTQEPPIIHRDIKPQNLKLTSSSHIILLDFGLAKGFGGQTSLVTTSGSVYGYTPNYASLEQIQGTGTDARSDIYSLGATLYSLLTGAIPPTALARASAMVNDAPDPLRPANEINPRVNPHVAAVLQRAMTQNAGRRFNSAAEMRHALRQAGAANAWPQQEPLAWGNQSPAADPRSAQPFQGSTPNLMSPTITDNHPATAWPVPAYQATSPAQAPQTSAPYYPAQGYAAPPQKKAGRIGFKRAILFIVMGLLTGIISGVIEERLDSIFFHGMGGLEPTMMTLSLLFIYVLSGLLLVAIWHDIRRRWWLLLIGLPVAIFIVANIRLGVSNVAALLTIFVYPLGIFLGTRLRKKRPA